MRVLRLRCCAIPANQSSFRNSALHRPAGECGAYVRLKKGALASCFVYHLGAVGDILARLTGADGAL